MALIRMAFEKSSMISLCFQAQYKKSRETGHGDEIVDGGKVTKVT